MKTNLVTLLAILFCVVGFSQKNEIKAAEKALRSGDSAGAKTALEAASDLVASADARTQAQYHLTRGKIYADLGKKGDGSAFDVAIHCYNETISIEEKSGKERYTAEAQQGLSALTADIINACLLYTSDAADD